MRRFDWGWTTPPPATTLGWPCMSWTPCRGGEYVSGGAGIATRRRDGSYQSGCGFARTRRQIRALRASEPGGRARSRAAPPDEPGTIFARIGPSRRSNPPLPGRHRLAARMPEAHNNLATSPVPWAIIPRPGGVMARRSGSTPNVHAYLSRLQKKTFRQSISTLFRRR